MSTRPNHQKLEKWQKWRDDIEHELTSLLGSRQVYNKYGKIVTSNKQVQKNGATFHNWVVQNYVTYVAMSIRRQADNDSDSISLARLITDMRDNPEHLTREWHASLYKNFPVKGYGDQMFSEHGGSGDFFDPYIAIKDLRELHSVSLKIKQLATRSIAHKSKKKVPQITFNDVDNCIDRFKEIAQKYILLLTAGHNVLDPIMDDWEEIFTERWIETRD